MATNYPNLQFMPQQQQNAFQGPQFFPQPQGNIYLINNSLEMANVPTGVGVSAAICLSEGVMYLKTMQNGNPIFIGYKISPLDGKDTSNVQSQNTAAPQTSNLDDYIGRIEALEKEINTLKQKTGSNLSELIQ